MKAKNKRTETEGRCMETMRASLLPTRIENGGDLICTQHLQFSVMTRCKSVNTDCFNLR